MKRFALFSLLLLLVAAPAVQAQTSAIVAVFDSAGAFFVDDSVYIDAQVNTDVWIGVNDAVSGAYVLFAIGNDTAATKTFPVWSGAPIKLEGVKATYMRRKANSGKVRSYIVAVKRIGK